MRAPKEQLLVQLFPQTFFALLVIFHKVVCEQLSTAQYLFDLAQQGDPESFLIPESGQFTNIGSPEPC